jgi:hypothetical protein
MRVTSILNSSLTSQKQREAVKLTREHLSPKESMEVVKEMIEQNLRAILLIYGEVKRNKNDSRL